VSYRSPLTAAFAFLDIEQDATNMNALGILPSMPKKQALPTIPQGPHALSLHKKRSRRHPQRTAAGKRWIRSLVPLKDTTERASACAGFCHSLA
jgi:hypothetical protein